MIIRYIGASLALLATSFLGQGASACTIFLASDGKRVFVGNNEDYTPGTRTFLWFRPGAQQGGGYVFWGFKERFPEGGFNERGLFFDAAALPKAIPVVKVPGRSDFTGYLVEPLLKECGSVEEALAFVQRYNLVWQEKAQIFLADRSGDYAIVHANYVIRKGKERSFSLTNYGLNEPESGPAVCWRRETAQTTLRQWKTPDVKQVAALLERTAQADVDNATLYSQAIDLKEGRIVLYQNRQFDLPISFKLSDELTRGSRNVELKSLFPPMDASRHALRQEAYAALKQKQSAEALALFSEATKRFPRASAFADLAAANLAAGNAEVARSLFRKALRLDPNDYVANLMGSEDGVVRFKLSAFPGAKKVSVAGEFNAYRPEAFSLVREREFWTGTLRLPPGNYHYKLVVDGVWNTDPHNGLLGKPGQWWDSLLIVAAPDRP